MQYKELPFRESDHLVFVADNTNVEWNLIGERSHPLIMIGSNNPPPTFISKE